MQIVYTYIPLACSFSWVAQKTQSTYPAYDRMYL